MNNFLLCIDFIFDLLMHFFNLLKSHWLLALVLVLAIFTLIVNLFLIIRGQR